MAHMQINKIGGGAADTGASHLGATAPYGSSSLDPGTGAADGGLCVEWCLK